MTDQAKPCLPYKCRWSGLVLIHAPGCPNAEPAPACFCGGRAVLGPIPQDGSEAEVQYVHATGCPKDVGPGSVWQLEAE